MHSELKEGWKQISLLAVKVAIGMIFSMFIGYSIYDAIDPYVNRREYLVKAMFLADRHSGDIHDHIEGSREGFGDNIFDRADREILYKELSIIKGVPLDQIPELRLKVFVKDFGEVFEEVWDRQDKARKEKAKRARQ